LTDLAKIFIDIVSEDLKGEVKEETAKEETAEAKR
jgi:hypothetical protein